jgi:hypothetical protein
LLLTSKGYPLAVVKAEPGVRLRYYEALEEASVKNHLKPFIGLIAECVEESLQRYIAAVR